MIIRVDKCKTFGVAKIGSTAKQTNPKLFVSGEIISALKKTKASTTLVVIIISICLTKTTKRF